MLRTNNLREMNLQKHVKSWENMQTELNDVETRKTYEKEREGKQKRGQVEFELYFPLIRHMAESIH